MRMNKNEVRLENLGVDKRMPVSLLPLQPCAGLGLLHGFVAVNFSGVVSLAPRSTPNWRTRDHTSSGPYPLTCLAWVAQPGAYASASIALRVVGERTSPLQDKAEEYWNVPQRNIVWGCLLDSADSGYGLAASMWVQDDTSGFMRSWEILYQLSGCQHYTWRAVPRLVLQRVQPLLCNGSVKSFPRQRIRMQQ
jgi:hypothetical protein